MSLSGQNKAAVWRGGCVNSLAVRRGFAALQKSTNWKESSFEKRHPICWNVESKSSVNFLLTCFGLFCIFGGLRKKKSAKALLRNLHNTLGTIVHAYQRYRLTWSSLLKIIDQIETNYNLFDWQIIRMLNPLCTEVIKT